MDKKSYRKLLTNSRRGFTLAEVLLTLTVIGVVAAMTIPALISNVDRNQTGVKLQKTYATLSDAFKRLTTEMGTPNDIKATGLFTDPSDGKFWTAFVKYINVSSPSPCNDCFNAVSPYYTYYPSTSAQGFIMIGTNDFFWNYYNPIYAAKIIGDVSIAYFNWSLATGGTNCTDDMAIEGVQSPLHEVCNAIAVDINGIKPPNKLGRDLFFFHIAKTGIYPMGSYGDAFTTFGECPNDGGQNCTAKILRAGSVE